MFAGFCLPQNLPQHAEPQFAVARGQFQATNKPADSFVHVSHSAEIDVTACAQHFEQQRCDSLQLGGARDGHLLGLSLRFLIANQFIETNGYCLPEIQRNILLASGDIEQPMAMAEVFIREAKLLRAEQNRNGARTEMFANCTGARLEAAQRMLLIAMSNGRGADYERAVGHSVRDRIIFLGAGQNISAAHGGARLAKGAFERIDDA